MTEPSMRNEIIKLLDSLGSDEDDEVLQAARQLHAQVMEADVAGHGQGVAVGEEDGVGQLSRGVGLGEGRGVL